jgi:hypothetical protein
MANDLAIGRDVGDDVQGLAERVVVTGLVVGVDCSETMLVEDTMGNSPALLKDIGPRSAALTWLPSFGSRIAHVL